MATNSGSMAPPNTPGSLANVATDIIFVLGRKGTTKAIRGSATNTTANASVCIRMVQRSLSTNGSWLFVGKRCKAHQGRHDVYTYDTSQKHEVLVKVSLQLEVAFQLARRSIPVFTFDCDRQPLNVYLGHPERQINRVKDLKNKMCIHI